MVSYSLSYLSACDISKTYLFVFFVFFPLFQMLQAVSNVSECINSDVSACLLEDILRYTGHVGSSQTIILDISNRSDPVYEWWDHL